MIDYSEALKEMHQGNVVKYVGTVNGNVMSDNGAGVSVCVVAVSFSLTMV
jgi:hypothetical protein